ncbi:MAG: ATP-binding protein, partial [Roseiflexaceae bacterium]|nr:ATP-binding protein [Roseiflexaceae bacterium]
MTNPGHIDIGGDAAHSILITGSHNVIRIEQAAAQARAAGRDPAQMLRVAALLAAPVFDPRRPERAPAPLDLRAEWERLARAVVGHPQRVLDRQAIAFTQALYADLTDGYPLRKAVDRAQRALTTHTAVLLGDGDLRFSGLVRGEALIDDARPDGNLPPGAGAGFVGRGAELVEIAQRLDRPPGVIVISGPPGIGKSRLAREAAHRNAWRFPGGVVYAEAWRSEGGGARHEARGERSEGGGARSEGQGEGHEARGTRSASLAVPGSSADADEGSAGAARAVDLLNRLADALR